MASADAAFLAPVPVSHPIAAAGVLQIATALLFQIALIAGVVLDGRGWAGDAFLLAVAVLAVLVAGLRPFQPASLRLLWPLLLLLMTYALSTLTHPGMAGLRITGGLFTAMAALAFHLTFGPALLQSRVYRVATPVLALLLAGLALTSGMNKNVAAGVAIHALLLAVNLPVQRARPRWGIALVLAAAALAAAIAALSDFRAMTGYAALLLTVFLAGLVLNARLFALACHAAMAAGIGGMIWFYLNINATALGMALNDQLYRLSGRSALSGREELWPAIVAAIRLNPLWGWGAGVVPNDIFATPYSAHNFYLQLTLQVGLIGAGLLALFMTLIWAALCRRTGVQGRFVAAVFFLLVIHNCTEVTMFQNQLIAAIPAWIVIGTGLGLARQAGG